jgi:hypothetical protein
VAPEAAGVELICILGTIAERKRSVQLLTDCSQRAIAADSPAQHRIGGIARTNPNASR